MSLQALDLLMQLPSEGQNDNEYVEFGKLDASFSFEDRSFIGRAFRTFPRWCFRVSFCCPVTARAS